MPLLAAHSDPPHPLFNYLLCKRHAGKDTRAPVALLLKGQNLGQLLTRISAEQPLSPLVSFSVLH